MAVLALGALASPAVAQLCAVDPISPLCCPSPCPIFDPMRVPKLLADVDALGQTVGIDAQIVQLQALSNFIDSYGILLLGLAVAIPFLVKRFLDSAGPIRSFFDGLIGFSLYRQSTGMTFLLGLSAVLETGAKFEEAIDLLKEDATPYVRERLEAVLAYDDLKPADALTATGYNWPDAETLELLQLYMEMKNPHEGIDVLVNDWFERAIEKYVVIGNAISTLCQFMTWGIVAWLYIVSNELTTNAASFAH